MTIFQSQLEQLMLAEELLFDSTPGFGRYRPYMEQALPHPAKMNVRLLEFLIKSHTKKGDVILDPMAGSGSTGVISALNGRNAVCVELEEKFFGWMEEARKKVESYSNLSDKGKVVNIKGDARQLSNLVQNADLVLTSPPYGEAQQGQGIAKYGYQGDKHSPTDLVGKRSCMPDKFESKDNIHRLSMGNIDAVITSPPYSQTAQDSESSSCVTKPPREGDVRQSLRKPPINRYSKSPDNIGNLPIDAVITSPPYSEGEHNYKHGLKTLGANFKGRKAWEEKRDIPFQESNIAMLPHGEVDAVITSPPYADAKKGGEADEAKMAERWDKTAKDRNWNTWGKTWKTEGRKRALKSLGSGYSKEKDNIGNLGFVDSVITSPPYEGSFEGGSRHTGGILEREKSERETMNAMGEGVKYSDSKEQIGNLKKETYLSAMFQVYAEMWKVLKPNGSASIVIKPFIRNKKVVDLPWHTWLLLEKVGFKLTKLYKLHLKQDSFWRVLYRKKYPEVPAIKHEYVLVCQKSPSFYC